MKETKILWPFYGVERKIKLRHMSLFWPQHCDLLETSKLVGFLSEFFCDFFSPSVNYPAAVLLHEFIIIFFKGFLCYLKGKHNLKGFLCDHERGH